MPDNPKKTGAADRSRVSKQRHEIAHESKASGRSASAVKQAVSKAGPMRKDVRKALRGS